jgi:hypothetical protein
MRELLANALKEAGVEQKIEVEFIDLPAYSPNFNLVEYIIHQIRLQVLHQPLGLTLEEKQSEQAFSEDNFRLYSKYRTPCGTFGV